MLREERDVYLGMLVTAQDSLAKLTRDGVRGNVISQASQLLSVLQPNVGLTIKSRVYDSKTQKGVTIAKVQDNSSASGVGISPGFLIERVNSQETKTFSAFARVVDNTKAGDVLNLYLNNGEAVKHAVICVKSKYLDFDYIYELKRMANGALKLRDEHLLSDIQRHYQDNSDPSGSNAVPYTGNSRNSTRSVASDRDHSQRELDFRGLRTPSPASRSRSPRAGIQSPGKRETYSSNTGSYRRSGGSPKRLPPASPLLSPKQTRALTSAATTAANSHYQFISGLRGHHSHSPSKDRWTHAKKSPSSRRRTGATSERHVSPRRDRERERLSERRTPDRRTTQSSRRLGERDY